MRFFNTAGPCDPERHYMIPAAPALSMLGTALTAWAEACPRPIVLFYDEIDGMGRGRIDLCVRMPFAGDDGKRAWQREALELKVWAKGKQDPTAQGLSQLEGYLDRLGLDRGVLVIFDRRPKAAPIHKRTRFQKARTPKQYAVTLLRA